MMKNMRCLLGKSSNELVVVVYKAQVAIAVSHYIKFKTQVFKVACLCVGMVLSKWRVSLGLHFFSLH